MAGWSEKEFGGGRVKDEKANSKKVVWEDRGCRWQGDQRKKVKEAKGGMSRHTARRWCGTEAEDGRVIRERN
jgi:hypothetical protein